MTEQEWMWDFGDYIKDRLSERHMSQGILARITGISKTTICRYISGDIMPSLRNFNNICCALDIDPRDVLSTDEFIK